MNFKLQFIALGVALVAQDQLAYGASGTIAGRMVFRSELGNSCDTTLGMDCTAARFPAAHTNSVQPIRSAHIQLVDQGGAVIGTGHSDNSGNFSLGWTRSTTPTSIQIRRFYTHKDNRFWHANTSGASWYGILTTVQNPTNGGTNNVGEWGWYSYDALNNNYDAALRTWEEALVYSNDMLSQFTFIRIILPAADANNAFVNLQTGIVHMGENLVRRPQAALSHELGHVVSNLRKPYSFCGANNFPTACVNVAPSTCNGTHSYDTAEHRCASYEEGVAQFVANVAYYWFWATGPRQCISNGNCTGNFNIETSLGTNCTNNVSRQELQVTRYLWDAYDSINDPGYNDVVPANPGSKYDQMINKMGSFGTGTGNNQNNEPFNAAMTQIDDPDGRSASDYKVFLDTIENTNLQYQNNCSP